MINMKKEGEWLVGILASDDAGFPIGELLRERWKLPKKTVHLLFQHKEIRLSGSPVSQHVKTEAGQEIRMRVCQPEPLGLDPIHERLSILFEDDHLLVVDKPAGLLLHPTEKHHRYTLDHLVAGYFAETGVASRVRHVHRLDQDTSGAVMYAKHALASALLDELLRARLIKRQYIAYTHGIPSPERGTVNQPIGKDRHHPGRRRVTPGGESAVTHYRVLERYRQAAKLQCELDTGRTHQIRVHLSYLGHPLMGDTLYGGKTAGLSRQALHAGLLRFVHPFGGDEVVVQTGLPADLEQLEKDLERVPRHISLNKLPRKER